MYKRAVVFFVAPFLWVGSASAATLSVTQPESATVNLYCRVKVSGKTFLVTGSGVFIHERGVILTNAHVAQYFLFGTTTKGVKADCSVRDGSPAKDRYNASVIYFPAEWAAAAVEKASTKDSRTSIDSDFALLQVTGAKKGELPEGFPSLSPDFGTPFFAAGESVRIEGYPAEGLKSKDLQKKLVHVAASSTITGVRSLERPYPDFLILSPSAASATGVSGGAVVRPTGGLVGIVVAIAAGGEPENERTLRAITLSYIDRLLRKQTGRSLTSYFADSNLVVNTSTAPLAELLATLKASFRKSGR